MKLKQLRMKAFGSFAKETIIDFDSMDGLWLTTGPTGSGKTTIFDAVMYALYGESSGDERDGNSMRSGYARPDEETFVELRFEQQGKEWTVYRSPAWKRPKQRGEGFTEQPARATLSSRDETLDKRIDTRLAEIIGVSADQFRQLAMIAQNDFRRILTENAKDRCDLLRKLLGTERYDRFQKKLKEMNDAAEERRKADRKAVMDEAKRFSWDNQSLLDDVIQNYAGRKDTEDVWPEQAVLDAMETQCDRENEELENADAIINPMREKQEEINRDLAVTEARHQRFVHRTQLTEQVNRDESEKSVREDRQRLLKRKSVALDILPLVKGKEKSITEVVSRTQTLETCKEKLRLADQKLEEARQNAGQTETLQKERDAAMGEIRHLTDEVLPVFGAVKKTEQTLKQISDGVRDAKNKVETIRSQKEKNRLEMEKEKQVADQLPQAGVRVVEAEAAVKNAEERVRRVRNLTELDAELGKRKSEHSSQVRKTQEAWTDADAAGKNLTEVKNAYYAAQAHMLAMDLEPGKACPVCGSMDHPRLAQLTDDNVTREQMMEAEKAAHTADKAYDDAKREMDRLQGRVEETENSLKEQSEELGVTGSVAEALAEANTSLEGKKEGLRQAEQARRTSEEAGEKLAALEKNAKRLDGEQEEAVATLQEQEKDESGKKAELDALRERLPEMDEQTARGTVVELQAKLRETENRIRTLEESLKAAEQAVNTLKEQLMDAEREKASAIRAQEQAEQELAASLREHAFASEMEVAELTKNADRNGIRMEMDVLTGWFTTLENRKTELDGLEDELKGQTDNDPQILRDALEQLKAEIYAKEQAKNGLLTRIRSNHEFCKRTLELTEKARESATQADFCRELFLSTQGRRGGMTFEIYVQRYYFERVVRHANRHLNEMTGDALQLCLQEPEESRGAYSGLDLSILDRATGKERDVATLSGGESFMASMSLALGLSDLVSTEISNVDLGILFIDEGFGTLDEDSLQQVLGVLNGLTEQSGKLVNVISHRPELREAIRNQIRVRKTDRGSEIAVQYR